MWGPVRSVRPVATILASFAKESLQIVDRLHAAVVLERVDEHVQRWWVAHAFLESIHRLMDDHMGSDRTG